MSTAPYFPTLPKVSTSPISRETCIRWLHSLRVRILARPQDPHRIGKSSLAERLAYLAQARPSSVTQEEQDDILANWTPDPLFAARVKMTEAHLTLIEAEEGCGGFNISDNRPIDFPGMVKASVYCMERAATFNEVYHSAFTAEKGVLIAGHEGEYFPNSRDRIGKLPPLNLPDYQTICVAFLKHTVARLGIIIPANEAMADAYREACRKLFEEESGENPLAFLRSIYDSLPISADEIMPVA